ncbi:CHAT domain-containing protein [Fodinibius saliphilus]|uniref:CHAT domain-containing protein n=1 Tax=Fodinibius saliphilus TaxID=1920650 RepID=UPI001109F860|nr:CHAT domain-containing protein [Fodinibius saliphilus]
MGYRALCKLLQSITSIVLLFLWFPTCGWAQPNGLQALHKADSLSHAAHYDSANYYYKKAVPLFEKEQQWNKKASALYAISNNKSIQGNLDKAEEYLNKARAVTEQYFTQDHILNVQYLYLKAQIAVNKANYDTALTYYQQATDVVSSVNSDKRLVCQIKILAGIGETYTVKGKYDLAIQKLDRAEALYHQFQLNNPRVLSRIYNSHGTVYKKQGNYNRSLEHYLTSLQIDRKTLPDQHPELAKSYNNIAIIYYYQSDYKRALDHMKSAVRVLTGFHGRNHWLVARGYNNIGIVYSEMGELAKATEYLKKTLSVRKNILGKDHPEIAIGYQNLGAIFYDRNKYEQAIENYKKAQDIHLKHFPEGHPELANVYANLGQAYDKKGNYKKALNFYHKDLDINLDLLSKNHPFIGDTYSKIGKTYAHINNFEQALQYFERAISIFVSNYNKEIDIGEVVLKDVLYPAKLLEVLQLKGQTIKQQAAKSADYRSLLDQSLQTYLQTVQLINKLQKSYNREESKFLLRERTSVIYNEGFQTAFQLYQETGNPDYKKYAFYFATQSQSQILLEQMQKDAAQKFANIPDSLIARETNLRNKLTTLQQQLSSLAQTPKQTDSTKQLALKDSLFHLQKTLSSHNQTLEETYPKYYRLKYQPLVTKVSEIQNKFLTPQETVIQYYFSSQNLYAFTITNSTFQLWEVSTDSLLTNKVNAYRKVLTEDSSVSDFRSGSYSLYQQLIEPIKEGIDGNKLLIIPDGTLHYLPFESLVTDPQKNQNPIRFYELPYLIHDYTVSYMTSANYFELYHQEQTGKSAPSKEFLAFAPVFSEISTAEKRDLYPGYNRPLPSLPLSKQEVHKVEELMSYSSGFWPFRDKKESTIFVKEEATEENFKNLPLKDYRYIHLATHAYVSEENPHQSGILFSVSPEEPKGGILHASEIYNLSLNAELVTLSACKTGVGEMAKGEGIISLSRAFQYAGARNLLVSLWNVNDRATSRLMIKFYEQYQNEESISLALQRGKKEIITKRRYAHPKYWAPFIFIGQ